MKSHTEAYQCHPPSFVAWSTPEWTIVSGGHNDRNPEVTATFSSQGSAVLHTADHGAVTATIAAGEVSVRGFHAAD